MNKLLLFLGLTILYYVVLLWFDQRGRKAFKAKQQALLAHTTELPIIATTLEPPSDLLGATTNLVTSDFLEEREKSLIPSTGLSKELKGGMEKLAAELDTPKVNKNDLMATLKSTTDISSIDEEETKVFVNSITRQ